jgi:hypothetical protein
VDDDLVTSLAREMVEQCAPEELPMFEATSELFVADPDRVEKEAARDEMLGFGIETALVAIAPFALAIARHVVATLLEQVEAALADESQGVVRDRVRALFKRFRGSGTATEDVPALTTEQLGRVKVAAMAKASELGLPEEQGRLLADSVAGSLATS